MNFAKMKTAACGLLVVAGTVQPLEAGLHDMLSAVQRKACSRDGAMAGMGAWCCGLTVYCLKLQHDHKSFKKALDNEKEVTTGQQRVIEQQQEEVRNVARRLSLYAQALTNFSVPFIKNQQEFEKRLQMLERYSVKLESRLPVLMPTGAWLSHRLPHNVGKSLGGESGASENSQIGKGESQREDAGSCSIM